MFDLGALASAKNKAKVNQDRKEEDFNGEYSKGLEYLKLFSQSKKESDLKLAASKFFESIKCKRSRIEPYIYLSYIFYLLDKNDLAKEYLNIAKSIDPTYYGIQNLQTTIYS